MGTATENLCRSAYRNRNRSRKRFINYLIKLAQKSTLPCCSLFSVLKTLVLLSLHNKFVAINQKAAKLK